MKTSIYQLSFSTISASTQKWSVSYRPENCDDIGVCERM
jgi:hypothetical protein